MEIDWENYKITEFEDISVKIIDQNTEVYISRQVDTIEGEEFFITVVDKHKRQHDGHSIKRAELGDIKLAIEMMLDIKR